jgi:hypothetical protein
VLRPRLPAPRHPAHRRPARRPPSSTRCPHPPRARSRGHAGRDQVRPIRSSTARPIQFRRNPDAPRPSAAGLPPAPQGPRQTRSPRHFAGRLRRTPRASPPGRGRPAASHPRRHGRAPPCRAGTHRRAPRCARCCRAKSQACSCVRRLIRQSVSGLATRSCAFSIKGERDRAQNRFPLLLIALSHAPLLWWAIHWVLIEPVAGSIVHDMF